MKISEVSNPFQVYLATVRVVMPGSNTLARTTITADSVQQARAMLARIYGAGNVFSISQVLGEAPQRQQNLVCAAKSQQSIPCMLQREQIASEQFWQVSETDSKTRVLSPQELQVRSLTDKALSYKQQAKALKARQQLAKAQQQLIKAQQARVA